MMTGEAPREDFLGPGQHVLLGHREGSDMLYVQVCCCCGWYPSATTALYICLEKSYPASGRAGKAHTRS